jgi:hypothetical protein
MRIIRDMQDVYYMKLTFTIEIVFASCHFRCQPVKLPCVFRPFEALQCDIVVNWLALNGLRRKTNASNRS